MECKRGRPARICLLAAVCCLGAIAPAGCVGPEIGGHFRSGSISWTKLEGNTVQFELLSEWKRSHSGNLVHGVPAAGRIFMGDIVRVGGQISPKLDFGDGAFAYVDVEVTSFSEEGDWFAGITHFSHTYETPNNGWRIDVDRYGDEHETQGAPWAAQFHGCCRWDRLANEANQEFTLKASFDLLRQTGSPAARSLGFTTACSQEVGGTSICKIPGSGEGQAGPCAKVPFTSIECNNAQTTMGNLNGFIVVPAAPIVQGISVEIDGTIRTPPIANQCLSMGQRAAGMSVRDGTVAFINIKNPGSNCLPTGNIQVFGGTRVPGGIGMRATFESDKNGKLARIIFTDRGSGYTEMPDRLLVAVTPQHPCTDSELEIVATETHVNVLVGAVMRHTNDCFDKMAGNTRSLCKPDMVGTDIKYRGTVIPQFLPQGFPGVGYGWDNVHMRPIPPVSGPFGAVFSETDVNGNTGKQVAYSHKVAYAGYDVSLTFNASVNWCQFSDMSVDAKYLDDERCVVKGTTVSYKYGPLPENVMFSMHQADAITDLMITYDNPFQDHRPMHEWAVNKLKRDYVNHPNSQQATQLGFTRINYNLNSGVGGASVYLWYKRWNAESARDGMEAITHLNISTRAEEEANFEAERYTKLDGNLNEQAGGNNVFIWYKKSAGHVKYKDHRPTQMGMEMAITNISFASPQTPQADVPSANDLQSVNPYFEGVGANISGQTAPGWVRVGKDLNSGTVSNNPIYLYWQRSQTNPTSQTLTWRPCRCDVGRQYICVSPQTSQMDSVGIDKVTGEQRCIAIDVVPDSVPEWKTPKPQQLLEFFIGRETRYPISVMVLNPDKEVEIEAQLPRGASLDVMTRPSSNCSHLGLCYARSRDLAWTPSWNQGGLTAQVCFKASDILTGCEPVGQLHESEVCATLLVRKCVYAINFEQHLQEVASLYHTDWLNIYSMNPTIKTPDRVLFQGQLINIGHLYAVVPGDTVSKIATRFGTGVNELLDLNAEISANEIFVGQSICIVPNSCKRD